ncbi:MAG: hypothetical protein NZ958_03285 [Bacteroidia bacterium]|nr:hypothetical protein [Bacteroidia bacterium]MDW8088243.1 hypothetical protein [Bacteroidia bacterium]
MWHRWVWTLGLASLLFGQGVGIGILEPHSAAILHLESSNKGLLLPRLTRAQRDGIQNPPAGLVIYNTDNNVVEYFNGQCWIPAYAESCEDCNFTLSLNPSSGVIDHVNTSSVQTTLTFTQTAGTPQPVALQIYSNLPPHTTYSFNPPILNGSGTATLTIQAEPIAPPGTYPIVVQVVCGNTIKNVIYTLTIRSCFRVDILNSTTDYNLTARNPNIPTNEPVCVVVHTHPGVEVSASSTNVPAFTTGNLHPQSVVALIHEGAFLGRGGDGARGAPFPQYSQAGAPGGDAMHITTRTYLYLRNGYIFGGGGGGGSAGVEQTFEIGPVRFSVGVAAGGGGGAQLGLGGRPSGNFTIGYFAPGQDATGGLTAYAGLGGLLSYTTSISLGPATITVTGQGYGGNGGEYGYPGRPGHVQVCIGGVIDMPWPIPDIPISIGCLPPGGHQLEPGGPAGYAIRRIGGAALVPYPDGNYLTQFLKGRIGP